MDTDLCNGGLNSVAVGDTIAVNDLSRKKWCCLRKRAGKTISHSHILLHMHAHTHISHTHVL